MTQTTTPFFGGKMYHCFNNSEGLLDGDDAQNYTPHIKPDARDAMVNGKWFVKVDGSNGLLVFNEETKSYDIYRRYDDKKRKFQNLPEGYIHLPKEGKNPDMYDSVSASHHYYQQLMRRPSANAKGNESAIWRELYSQVDKAFERGVLKEKYHSVEFVGKNFSSTPNVNGIGIALHSAQEIPLGDEEKKEMGKLNDEEWFKYFVSLFDDICQEGIIFEWKGMYWKIRAEWFSKSSAWKRCRSNAPAPVLI